MANQSAARIMGDDYQHLYAWYLTLELLRPSQKVQWVTVEDSTAGSVDDVTLFHEDHSGLPDEFYQIKYHVDQRNEYSTESIISCKRGGTSLLAKFWSSWNLVNENNRGIELYLLSNWTWDGSDSFKQCISGKDNSIDSDFLTAPPKSKLGKTREKWKAALGLDDTNTDFESFIKSLRIKVGFDCTQDLENRVTERMEQAKLRCDQSALTLAIGIVRNWVKAGKQKLGRTDLEATLQEHGLYDDSTAERGVTIYLSSIKPKTFDIPPDYNLDWCDYFLGDHLQRGRQPKEASVWNAKLLPELKELEAQINADVDIRLIRARGFARLSHWFAFGYQFSQVARYTIEVDQQGKLWRTDAEPNSDFSLVATLKDCSYDGEAQNVSGSTVAVGLSVTGSLEDDVRQSLKQLPEKSRALLLLQPERELGESCLRNAGDVVALAQQFKKQVVPFVKKYRASRLLLFYYGPLSGACFIGHRLNAVCKEVQIMERQDLDYCYSFTLR